MKKIKCLWNKFVAHIIIDGFGLLSEFGQWLYGTAGKAAHDAHKILL